MLKKIKHIIIGNFNSIFSRNNNLYKKRYKICRACPLIENINIIGEICGMCGCPLKSKLRVKDEVCDIHRWE